MSNLNISSGNLDDTRRAPSLFAAFSSWELESGMFNEIAVFDCMYIERGSEFIIVSGESHENIGKE